MMATGTRMTKTQKERFLENFPQSLDFLGAFLFGSCMGITASSLYTANGGSSPRDQVHIQPETHVGHRIPRTWYHVSVHWRFACATARRSRESAVGAPPADRRAD